MPNPLDLLTGFTVPEAAPGPLQVPPEIAALLSQQESPEQHAATLERIRSGMAGAGAGVVPWNDPGAQDRFLASAPAPNKDAMIAAAFDPDPYVRPTAQDVTGPDQVAMMTGFRPPPAATGPAFPTMDMSRVNEAAQGLRDVNAEIPGVAKDQRAAIRAKYEADAGAVRQESENQALRASKTADLLQGAEDRIANQEKLLEPIRKKALADVDGAMANFDQAVKAANSASIDPDRWYRDAEGGTTGRRIGAAISLALGAFGAAFTKGPNYAMQIINDAINRDLSAQRAEMGKKAGAVGAAQSAVGMARNAFTDVEARGHAEKAAELSKAIRMVEISKSQSESDEATAKADGLIEAMTAERDGELAKSHASELDSRQKAGTQALKMEMGLAQEEYNRKLARARAGGGQRVPRGLRVKDPLRPLDPKDVEKAKDIAINTNKAVTQLDRALAMRGKEGFKFWTSGAGDVIMKNLTFAVAKAQGISNEGLVKAVSDPKAFFGISADIGGIGNVAGRLQAAREGLLSNTRAALDTYNLDLDTFDTAGGERVK